MERSFGIGDIAVYIPQPQISLDTLIGRYTERSPQWARTLARARRRTGQESLRFPRRWEDSATMAAQAAAALLGRMSGAEIASLRYLVVGTESGVDQAKPVAAQRAGHAAACRLRAARRDFHVRHSARLRRRGNRPGQRGGDARGEPRRAGPRPDHLHGRGALRARQQRRDHPGSGRGGAAGGARSAPSGTRLHGYRLRIARRRRLLRPLGSVTARVRGRFSIACYQRAVEEALLDLGARTGRDLPGLLEETDLFALHVPFRSLPEETMAALVRRHLGADAAAAARFLAQRQFAAGTALTAVVGNVYSGALFLCVASLLAARASDGASALPGQRVVLVAYGSGNTALAFSGRIRGAAAEVVASWSLEHLMDHGVDAGLAEYDAWIGDYASVRGAAPAAGRCRRAASFCRRFVPMATGPTGSRDRRREREHAGARRGHRDRPAQGASSRHLHRRPALPRSAAGGTSLDEVRLVHQALPELDYGAIDTGQRFLRARLRLPLLISCMTGGSGRGRSANRALAEAAERAGIAVGVGSIRPLLRDPDTFADFHVKPHAPDVPCSPTWAPCNSASTAPQGCGRCGALEVQGLVVHLNAGQELFQPDGDRDFRGLLAAIAGAVEGCGVPVLVKETGFGIGRARCACCWATGALRDVAARAAPTGSRWRGNGWPPPSGTARGRSTTGAADRGCCWRRSAPKTRAA